MTTIEIKNPEIQLDETVFESYDELIFKIGRKREYNNQLDDLEPDGKLYPMSYDELTDEQKKTLDKIDTLEFEEYIPGTTFA